jgi:hypothetical protein
MNHSDMQINLEQHQEESRYASVNLNHGFCERMNELSVYGETLRDIN